jgi:hypothetical protein
LLFPSNDHSTVINTITLDDKASAADLERMAAGSGGKYVHIISGETK